MAKLVGTWEYVEPRKVEDDVNLVGATTLIMTEADRRKLGDNSMKLQVRVMDDDTFGDDTVYADDSFQVGPALSQVGPNTIGLNAVVKHSKVEDSEPVWEGSAELYFKVRAVGPGVVTNWATSQNEDVPYE
ncbi:hypothetical protein [Actinopolymorpha rutila]|uniref:Uncharacterized protein n=1 Tax=Actinopolymorpha rutila TaxID=446787 RepID=A0A852ZJT0_9ACTN|nr:hypothetical protein [Actinopolymorpha rutila]NYH93341.1 hypothetical protein [Actinopolymorpha rutila]